MIKKITKAVMMLAGILLAGVPMSHATTGVTVSSTTSSFIQTTGGAQPIPGFLVRKGESLFAIINATGTGLMAGTTVNIEASTNMSNWLVVATTASGTPGGVIGNSTYTFATVAVDTFYRFNVLASSNGALCLTFRDNDDIVSVLKSNKQLDSIYFNDDSVNVFGAIKPNRFQYQQSGSSNTPAGPASTVLISSRTQFVLGPLAANDKQYSILFSSNIQPLENNFVVITLIDASSATMISTPVISTQTATNGDTLTFTVLNSTVAFPSLSVQAGSGLKLGADVRSVGAGDMLQLIFFNGFWRELFFSDNRE